MPVLRVHFTPEDLARTRLARFADDDWETALSLKLLQSSEPPGALGPWRTWARPRVGPWLTPLLAAAASAEHFPGFLDHRAQPEKAELERLLRRYHAAVIAPIWPTISTAVATDRTRRTRSLLESGLEGLLGNLGPTTRWRQPVLELASPLEHELHLTGEGMVLIPAYFCVRQPMVIEAATGATVLIHPISPAARPQIKQGHPLHLRPESLDALMGSTRAAMLQTLGEGCTTTELAQRLGVTAACASQHATVLREAGLISTHRHGPSVLHIVTALGSAVLEPRDRVSATTAP